MMKEYPNVICPHCRSIVTTYFKTCQRCGKELDPPQSEFENDKKPAPIQQSPVEEKTTAKKPEKSCKNCKSYVAGECGGVRGLCEEYEERFSISKEEMDSWPKFGDATTFRMKWN